MVNHKVDLRNTLGMARCALLSLVAFLAFLILMAYSDRLLSNDGDAGGLVQWVKRKAVLLRPASRRDGQPISVPVES